MQKIPTEDLYLFKDLKRVPGKGMLVFYDGALYPARGFPQEQAFTAINYIKRTLRESFKYKLLFLYSNKKLVKSFNDLCSVSLGEAIHELYVLCPAAEQIRKIVYMFLIELGIDALDARECAKYIAYVFEYDNAYRYRVQDLATEASDYLLVNYTEQEMKHLLEIYRSRDDNPVVNDKFSMFYRVFYFALKIPKYKRAFKKAMSLGMGGLRYDREDWYWVCQRGDYRFAGMTKEERLKEFDIYPKLYTREQLEAMVS